MRRRLLALLVVLLLVAGGTGAAAVATSPAALSTTGPTEVSGTDATAVFRIADRTLRQVRYKDKATLTYRFRLHNDGSVPITITGLSPLARSPKLFRYLGLRDATGDSTFSVPAGGSVPVALTMRMQACETLSARAGSFATEMNLQVTRARFLHDRVTVTLPEELHTGSPREAFCPDATATSRPPG